MPNATAKQIGFIHGLAARAGMDEDTRRVFLQRETGRRSCKELTPAEADTVIQRLRALAGNGAVRGLDTPVARKLRALWIAGWNLGLVRERNDTAMLAFVERQTGVSHTRFLGEPGDGSRAVEGLKAWLARDAGVVWPAKGARLAEIKRAVIVAQWARLIALGVITPGQPIADPELRAYSVADANGWDLQVLSDYDSTSSSLGRTLRRALARRQAKEPADV